jgi:hypothetical protein
MGMAQIPDGHYSFQSASGALVARYGQSVQLNRKLTTRGRLGSSSANNRRAFALELV